MPIGDLLNHDSCKTNYYYAKISDLPPDYYPEGKESEDEDDDEEMYESPVSINLSSQKLYKLNFGVYSHSDEDFLEISKQIALQAKKNDAKLFINKLKVADKLSTVTTVEESNEKFFIISAAKDKGFEAGEQVCIPYGRYSNRILLTNYGFAMTKNKYNYARIKISLKDLLTESQREKLTQNYDPDMRIAFKIKSSFLNTDLLEIIRGLL